MSDESERILLLQKSQTNPNAGGGTAITPSPSMALRARSISNLEEEKTFYFLSKRIPSQIGTDKGEAQPSTRPVNMGTIPSVELEIDREGSSPTDVDGSDDRGWRWIGIIPWIKSFFSTTYETTKQRKVPVKIEPKVYFANERTFLAWMEMSVTLATISVAIVAFAEANELSQIYGLFMMPVAISFCLYSLWLFMNRAAMIRRKDPGPYEALTGPIVLSTLLALAIICNFVVKILEMNSSS